MLWLLRHAHAEDGVPDDERPLSEIGRAHARAAGAALRRLDADIELCLTSPKRRARETARLACETLGVEVTVEPALAGPPFDARALAPGVENVLLVGHDPSFSMTLHDLTGTQARMKKGGLAAVKKGELIVLLRPTELSAIALADEVTA